MYWYDWFSMGYVVALLILCFLILQKISNNCSKPEVGLVKYLSDGCLSNKQLNMANKQARRFTPSDCAQECNTGKRTACCDQVCQYRDGQYYNCDIRLEEVNGRHCNKR